MADKYKQYQNLSKLFIEHSEIIDVYKDIPDGDYCVLKGESHSNGIDWLESDGQVNFYEDENFYNINNSSYVVIKSYDCTCNQVKLNRISLVLSFEGFGLLQSVLLSNGDYANFNKLIAQDGYVKGNLEQFDFDCCNGSVIVPYNKKANKTDVKIRSLQKLDIKSKDC